MLSHQPSTWARRHELHRLNRTHLGLTLIRNGMGRDGPRPALGGLPSTLTEPPNMTRGAQDTERTTTGGVIPPDAPVLQAARDQHRVLVSVDMDFGTILARRRLDDTQALTTRLWQWAWVVWSSWRG